MTASIIIAVKIWQKNLEECVDKCLALNASDFEIIVLPDRPVDIDKYLKNSQVKIIPTGALSPAKKRDLALSYAQGEILAFIDDDAYPAKAWLKNGLKNFKDKSVAAVGGPGITPLEDNTGQKASGLVYSSYLVSATQVLRYVPKKRREVDDFPSCNFLVRKSIMQELNGFNTNFWPGEDTKLCLDITKRLGKKIIYDPDVLVWHHRRPLIMAHIKQVASYALHRGYFVKSYPQTSYRFVYFVPSIFLSAVITGGILSILFTGLRLFYLWSLFFYLFLVVIFSISKQLSLLPLVFLGTIVTHLTYGIYFIKGLLSKRLKEE